MEETGSNAQKGSDAVDELVQLLESGDPALLLACDSIIKVQDPEMPKNWGPTVGCITKVKGSFKSDMNVVSRSKKDHSPKPSRNLKKLRM